MEYKEDSVEAQIDKRFQRLEKIGSGAYGYVWKVREKITGEVYALKKVFLAFQNDVDAQRTYRQIGILRQLNHPNIVKLIEVIKAENNLDLYLLFEYVECDLFNAIKDGVLNQVHKKYIIYQLAKALYYLHSAGILHRDLKPSNILIDANCKIKICDFGLSRTLYRYDNQDPHMTEFIATRWYRAPEVLFGSRTYSQKSDLWSLGCVIYEIFAARPLMPGNDSVNQIQKVLEFKGFPNQQQMNDLKVDRLDILLSHFKNQRNPEDRYFKPDWSRQLVLLLKSLLTYSPKTRWNSEDVLNCDFIEPFHHYEELIKARVPVILRVSDNSKNDKEFYRNFIHKFYLKKVAKNFDRPLLRIPNRSLTPKKYAETSLRGKKVLKNASSSLHTKNSSIHKSNISHQLINKKSSKTIISTGRGTHTNQSRKSTINRQSPGISHKKYLGKQNASKQHRSYKKPFRSKQKNNSIQNMGNNQRLKLEKDASKSILKEETNKKILKRRAYVYL